MSMPEYLYHSMKLCPGRETDTCMHACSRIMCMFDDDEETCVWCHHVLCTMKHLCKLHIHRDVICLFLLLRVVNVTICTHHILWITHINFGFIQKSDKKVVEILKARSTDAKLGGQCIVEVRSVCVIVGTIWEGLTFYILFKVRMRWPTHKPSNMVENLQVCIEIQYPFPICLSADNT